MTFHKRELDVQERCRAEVADFDDGALRRRSSPPLKVIPRWGCLVSGLLLFKLDWYVRVFLDRDPDDLRIASHVPLVVNVEFQLFGDELARGLLVWAFVSDSAGGVTLAVNGDGPLLVLGHASRLPRRGGPLYLRGNRPAGRCVIPVIIKNVS
jgi:hypothetical protein